MDSALKSHMAPPLSLLVLGALTPTEHQVELADENVERMQQDDRPDLVAITVKVDAARRAWTIADAYRARGIPVVLGGVHVSACPQKNLAHADAVVIGEAEGVWQRLLSDLKASALQKVYKGTIPVDLSASPVPKWELLEGKNYLYPVCGSIRIVSLFRAKKSVTTSSSCPKTCWRFGN